MEIIISGENPKHLRLVEELATELGLFVSDIQSTLKTGERSADEIDKSERLYQLMEEMAAKGGIKSIPDPLKWQKETRKDKPLYGRE